MPPSTGHRPPASRAPLSGAGPKLLPASVSTSVVLACLRVSAGLTRPPFSLLPLPCSSCLPPRHVPQPCPRQGKRPCPDRGHSIPTCPRASCLASPLISKAGRLRLLQGPCSQTPCSCRPGPCWAACLGSISDAHQCPPVAPATARPPDGPHCTGCHPDPSGPAAPSPPAYLVLLPPRYPHVPPLLSSSCCQLCPTTSADSLGTPCPGTH